MYWNGEKVCSVKYPDAKHITRIEWQSRERDQKIAVVGSWTNYEEFQDLQYDAEKGVYAVELEIPTGERYYRLLIDGEWKTDDNLPKTVLDGDKPKTVLDGDIFFGDEYNVINVKKRKELKSVKKGTLHYETLNKNLLEALQAKWDDKYGEKPETLKGLECTVSLTWSDKLYRKGGADTKNRMEM
jgi:hypothetical protein